MSLRLVWVDGRILPESEVRVRWDAPGLREGYGLFETIRVARGRAFLAGCHSQRITDAAARLSIEAWLHPRTLTRGIDRLVRESGIAEGAVRVYVLPSEMSTVEEQKPRSPSQSQGTREADATSAGQTHFSRARYLATVSESSLRFPTSVRAMLALDLRDTRGPLVGLKTLSRAAESLLLAQARARGAAEVLRRNLAGRVTEGTRSNVFLVEGSRLVTPPVDEGLLAGITRWFLLRIAKDGGFTPVEEPITVKRLLTADEACLTSTLRGVVSLLSVDADPIGTGGPGQKSETLRRLLEKHMAQP